MGATSGAGTIYPSGEHEFAPAFSEVRVARSLVFCVVFCRLLFVVFVFVHLVIGLLFMNRSVNSNVQEFDQH